MTQLGIPTHHARVERWECDFNNHWNVRYYGRSFQMAAEAIGAQEMQVSPGAAAITARHMRFHRELLVGAPVEVRSASLAGGEFNDAVVHLLTSEDELAATALDLPGGAEGLPRVTAEQLRLAMPRGLDIRSTSDWPEGGGRDVAVSLGPIRPSDLDHTGELMFEHILRHAAVGSHMLLNGIGLTPEFSRSTGINRMNVESFIRRRPTPAAGTLLYGRSKLLQARGKNLWMMHRIATAAGEIVASIEQCLVTVDLRTRRAVEVPDFLYSALKQ